LHVAKINTSRNSIVYILSSPDLHPWFIARSYNRTAQIFSYKLQLHISKLELHILCKLTAAR